MITGRPKLEEKRREPLKDATKRRPTLKELEEKKYPFLDSNLLRMFDDLTSRAKKTL